VNRLFDDSEKLTAILAYHMVPGRFTSADEVRLASAVTTVVGSDLRVATKPHLTVNGARIVHADVEADNGVIHLIDRVLLPLDDLGNVQVTFANVTVVEPETVLVVAPAGKPAKHKKAKAEHGKHEDLQTANMVQNHQLAKSISDAGWRGFLSILSFQAVEAGKTVVAVPPAYTSQACSGCGVLVHKGLSVRWHACPDCGSSLHRDHNAARNILRVGTERRGAEQAPQALTWAVGPSLA
jgi:IS605 OrfB family transposase